MDKGCPHVEYACACLLVNVDASPALPEQLYMHVCCDGICVSRRERFIIHLRLNNVQQSMEKPGTQAQLIKTRILYCWSREKSVLVLLVTREIRINYVQ